MTAASTERRLEIVNIKGLHARPAAKIAALVESFEADATFARDGMSAEGESIMGLLMLAASRGSFIDVSTRGPDAEALADAIEALIADRFGEAD